MEVILLFFAPVVLWVLALIISTGKANFLIAGYNTASQEEKSKIDGKALAKFMGKFLFILGLIQFIIPISKLLKIDNFWVVMICVNIVLIITIIGGVIYMNTGKRFRR